MEPILGIFIQYREKRLEEHFHMSPLTRKPFKELQSFYLTLMQKDINSRDDFCIMGKEKDQYFIRLKESIFISQICD